jgi:3-dehydroquinate dehydratase-2
MWSQTRQRSNALSTRGASVADVLVLNGPNLGRLGTREPQVYGTTTHDELVTLCQDAGRDLSVDVEVRQTDAEHEMIGWLHEAADSDIAVVLNPGGWTHTSVALRDACAALTAPLVELHISNVHAREEFRRHSYVSPVATAVMAGFGVAGYALAIRWLAERQRRSV